MFLPRGANCAISCYPSIMVDAVASTEIPYGRLDWKDNQIWVILTARRTGGEEPVTIEIALGQWIDLAPVQYVMKTELSRQQPRRPGPVANDSAPALSVPRGHIEWKEGQNWVVLTACLLGSQTPVTVEITLGQWFALIPVRYAVEEQLERWEANKQRQRGYWTLGPHE
jgi:hypothetical protein